jgi:hypothetical protein
MLVLLENYKTQSLSEEKSVVICLDLSIVGLHDSIIGSPSEFCPPPPKVFEKIDFFGVSFDGVHIVSKCHVIGCCMALQLCSLFVLHMVALPTQIICLQTKHAGMLHIPCILELRLVILGRPTEYQLCSKWY